MPSRDFHKSKPVPLIVENSLIAVVISGRGANLQALVAAERQGRLGGRIVLVVSNRPGAPGLEHARQAGIETLVLPHQHYAAREAYDAALVAALRQRGVTFICLAGFMRLVSRVLCDAFPGAIVNIHPSLLPSFPGPDAQRQALQYGVCVTGATVHFVTPDLDAGPIILQGSVPVRADDTVDSLSARILQVEQQLYPKAVRLVLGARWRLDGRRVIFPDADVDDESMEN
jgi:phosphoribosylglycinamide formyltransferase-1